MGNTGLITAIVIFVILWLVFMGLFIWKVVDCNQTETEKVRTPSSYATFKEAAVASDAGPCSEIGAKKLKLGGSVVDAAIATMVCGGLYNPQSSGIGGGSFISYYNPTSKEVIVINSRETAPIASYRDMYIRQGSSSIGEGSAFIAVPGEVAGYWEAHQRYGKLEWAKLFEESITLASEGIEVSEALERDIAKQERIIRDSTFNLKAIFVNRDGSLKKRGDKVTRPALAQTLRAIADKGIQGFYNGMLAERILADIEDAVGESVMTLQDLRSYKVEVKPLINITLGDFTIFTPGPPSSGPVLILILNILKGYGFTPASVANTNGKILTYHRIIEAFKFAYARRSQLGDEAFSKEVKALVANMAKDWYANNLRLQISDFTTQSSSFYGGSFARIPDDFGTSHVSIVGTDGSAISATSTINTWFGSKVRGIRTGIIFNDQMKDFSSPAATNNLGQPTSSRNFIEPRKRPMSSMVPTIVLERGSVRPKLIVGASGGTKITTATALVTMDVIWFGDRLIEAVSAKRFHHKLFPEYVEYENGFDRNIIAGLRTKNHVVEMYNSSGSVVQAILSSRYGSGYTAVCDERKGGYPDGF